MQTINLDRDIPYPGFIVIEGRVRYHALFALERKFLHAGFGAPTHRLSDAEVYGEVIWKDPSEIYL